MSIKESTTFKEDQVDFEGILKDIISSNESIKKLVTDKVSFLLKSVKDKDVVKNLQDFFSGMEGLNDFDKEDIKRGLTGKITEKIERALKGLSVNLESIKIDVGPVTAKVAASQENSPSSLLVGKTPNQPNETIFTSKFFKPFSDLFKINSKNIKDIRDSNIDVRTQMKEMKEKMAISNINSNNDNEKDEAVAQAEKNTEAINKLTKSVEILPKAFSSITDKLSGFTQVAKEKVSWWAKAAGILGAAFLAYLNKDKIIKWFNESGLMEKIQGIWETVKPVLLKYKTEFLEPLFKNYIGDPFKAWWKEVNPVANFIISPLEKWWKEPKPLVLKIAGLGGITNVKDDDPFQGLRKTILDLAIINPISKSLTKLMGSAGFIKKMGPNLAKFLGKVPIIGTILSIGEGLNYLVQDKPLYALMSFGAGLAYLIPGAGTIIGTLIDASKAGMQIAESKGKFDSKAAMDNVLTFLKKVPGIGGIIYAVEAMGAFSAGDWKTGLQKLMFVVPGVNILGAFLEEDAKKVSQETGQDINEIIRTRIKRKIASLIPASLKSLLGMDEEGELLPLAPPVPIERTEDQHIIGKKLYLEQLRSMTKANGEKLYDNYQLGEELKKYDKKFNVQKTQDFVMDKGKITFVQPDNSDKLYPTGRDSGIMAKADGVLNKTFEKMYDSLATQVKIMNQQLNEVKLIHKQALESGQYLKSINDMLPSLQPIPPEPATTNFSSGDERDPIYDYRVKNFDMRGV